MLACGWHRGLRGQGRFVIDVAGRPGVLVLVLVLVLGRLVLNRLLHSAHAS